MNPCPFCGSTDLQQYVLSTACNRCYAHGPIGGEDCEVDWSRRVPAAPAWTQEPPIAEGRYWHWSGDERYQPSICEVFRSDFGLGDKEMLMAGQSGRTASEAGGWWLPVEVPAIPKMEAIKPKGES